MIGLLILAVLLGACARPGLRTEAILPEVTISPSADPYQVETSQDGLAWSALGETQAATWIRVKRAAPTAPVEPPQPTGTHFVDPSLSTSCTSYDPLGRTCGGAGKATAYPTWQAAAAVAEPGQTWFLRGGTYNLPPRGEIVLSRAGAEGMPITWEGYEAEAVVVKGPYDMDIHSGATCAAGDGVRDWDEDCNNDAQHHADGPSDSGDRAVLVAVRAPWQVVRRVRIGWGFKGLYVSAPHVVVDEVVVHDTWETPIGTNQADNVFRHVAAIRGRHRTGVFIGAGANRTVIYRSLSYGNGTHCTNADCSQRTRVRSINGDDSDSSGTAGRGGENADSFSANKDCKDIAPAGDNLCNGNVWQETVGWDSVDGAFDTSERGGAYIGNVAVSFNRNGGPAFKSLRADSGNVLSSNVWWRGLQNARGGEYRTTGDMFLVHNLALRSQGHGHIASEQAGQNRGLNNVGYLDGGQEFNGFGAAWTLSNNWDGDTQGDPGLTDNAADPAPALAVAESCLVGAPHAVSVRSCWQTLYQALTAPLRPKAGSPLIDKGALVPDYHCAKADDDASAPEPATSACRHWRGAAPDQGPFEFGIEATFNNGSGNPDKSRCAAIGSC
jgi:hypothetical protein